MKYQLKVTKFGKSDYGNWVLGQITNGVFCYSGLFNIDKSDIELSENLVVNVKNIIVSQNQKNNKLIIRIVL